MESAETITVSMSDGRSLDAKIIVTDPLTDLSVIRIDSDSIQPVVLGDSDSLEVWQDVIAIGHALDLPGGPTAVVSALNTP